MSAASKDRMVDGAEIHEQILSFNKENKDIEIARTPKRHHSGEQRITKDNQKMLMNDEDEEFETVTHQRKKFQRESKEKYYEEQNDVIWMHEEMNDQLQRNKQQEHQYMQKRKTTNSSCMFYNGEMTAMNHRLKNAEKKKGVKQTDQQGYLSSQEHERRTTISNHALHYAVEQHLPPINIKCEPKITDQKLGTMIIKELFVKIEKNFRHLNANYEKPLGFEYWFIDRDDNLQCFTRSVELFVFLCNPQNYPEKLLNTTIHPNPPKRLPPQRSAILKYVSKDIHIDDIKKEISSKYKSLFNIEEMRGTIGAKNRHIRIELSEHNEYINILNTGIIAFEGQLIEVSEFLAPPRLLICSRCNTPGHLKKECKNNVDLCRRCGLNRNEGEHKECIIKCHHCNGNHEATSYQCPLINDFRKELILKLKSRPDLLPQNVQLFIPTQYRSHGEKENRILFNNNKIEGNVRMTQQQQYTYHQHTNEWPLLSNNSDSTAPNKWLARDLNRNNIWRDMTKSQEIFDSLKKEFNKQEIDIAKRYQEHKLKLGSILSVMSVQIQQQNENLKPVFTTISELIPIVTLSLGICQQLATTIASSTNDRQVKLPLETTTSQIQTLINFLNEQHQLISSKHSKFVENFEKNNQLLQHGIELFTSASE
ncbi:unnamed protein product [Rotaria magnacalcarata]|uniref:CCHC-type domain-containing protein n=2 Tax=Rotaria magnacalcarata TaxID=392030 RepID=A0A816H363_9BILA|nr:unnamed protein product [Rotaria magnacalcarata]CAF4378451.1 unnamed protein product [Rotaria magnacalcarata]